MKFTDYNLHKNLLKGLEKAEYTECMPVQEHVLQQGLQGADLYVQSQTGTGKTAAYLIPILQQLLTQHDIKNNKALILVPTRELAVQVEEEAILIASALSFKIASFYGGVGYEQQHKALGKGIDIIVGTPGRVIDLQESGVMDLSNVGFLVIDEADRMFDMGFYPDLRTLIKVLPKKEHRQTMLFSATLNTWVKNLAWEYTVEAIEIEIESENITVDEIEQLLFHVAAEEKMQLLLGLIKKENPENLIIFCNTKKMSEIVSKRLALNDIKSKYIIGDLPQSKRLQLINSFKAGDLKYLVATDVAARGIDVEALEMVINYDLPNEAENYVHRIGRTARAGKSGKAYSLCSEQDVYNLPAIEKYIEKKIPSCVPGADDLAEDKSKNVYIRLESADSDYEEERGTRYSNRTRASTDFRRRPPSTKAAPYKKGSPANSQKTSSYKGGSVKRSDYKKPSSQGSKPQAKKHIPTPDLSRLSFDERMEYYKKKYNQDAPQTSSKVQKTKQKAQPKSKTVTHTKPAKTKINQNPTKENKGLASKIKSFFTKQK